LIGTSGWSYPHWRGTVYDPGIPAKEWFSCYSRLFNTVELNNTFYRLAPPATFKGWREGAPPGFVFALKVSQFGTHRLKLKDPARWLPQFVERALLLGPHLGPNLVQLPPRWKRDLGRLADFLGAACQAGGPERRLRWAIEFRDPSWLDDGTYELLRGANAALCCHDLLPEHPWLLTADWAYARFHGPQATAERYAGEYGAGGLHPAARKLAEWQQQGCDIYAYFNNDSGGAAVRDAACLAHLLGSG